MQVIALKDVSGRRERSGDGRLFLITVSLVSSVSELADWLCPYHPVVVVFCLVLMLCTATWIPNVIRNIQSVFTLE